MSWVVKYVETDAEIADEIESVRRAAESGMLELDGVEPEEYVAGLKQMYVILGTGEDDYSLGGVETWEASSFLTHAGAADWIRRHADDEPGEFVAVASRHGRERSDH